MQSSLPHHGLKAPLPDHRFVLVGQRGWNCADVLREVEASAGRAVVLGYVDEGDLPLMYAHATANQIVGRRASAW
mgnify:CR=1 FL=1